MTADQKRDPFRYYSDGTLKTPHMGQLCADPDRSYRGQSADWGHRVCGGWYCTCPCHDANVVGGPSAMEVHAGCDWVEVDRCVYCSDHPGVRLYQGSLSAARLVQQIDAASHQQVVEEWALMRDEVMAYREASSG